jgi:hypothetical protein
VRPGWDGKRGVGLAKEGLGWRQFTFLVVSVVRKNPNPHPDPGRLWVVFVPKEGTETSSQKGHVVLSPSTRKILDLRTNRNPEIMFCPTPTHGSRNGLSLYAGLERLDQQPGRALLSRANHQPPPPFGKIKLCLTLTKGLFPLSRNVGLSKPKRGQFIWNHIFRRKPSLLVWSP